MRCQRSLEFKNRLNAFLELIETGEYCTPGLVATLGVSIPTISRSVETLRKHGRDIRAVRNTDGWHKADTCREIAVARLVEAGTGSCVLLVRGKLKRSKQNRADYLLRHTRDSPIAVVKPKADYTEPDEGRAQAQDYAKTLDIKFECSTNGAGILKFAFLTGTKTDLSPFPSPHELWQQLNQTVKLCDQQQEHSSKASICRFPSAISRNTVRDHKYE